jgi:hypothetical protein
MVFSFLRSIHDKQCLTFAGAGAVRLDLVGRLAAPAAGKLVQRHVACFSVA